MRDSKTEVAERMWVLVKEVGPKSYLGELSNHPHCTDQLKLGLIVAFRPMHVIDIINADDAVD